MSVNPRVRDVLRQSWPKRQPRQSKPKNPGESATRKLLAARSGGLCERCGIAPAESVHHRWKQGQGGPWSASNCVNLCGDGVRLCHGYAELNPDDANDEGLHLRPWQDSAAERFLYRGQWVLLSDDGGIRPIEGGAA